MRTTLKDVEENVKPLGGKLTYDKEFIFDLLAAYGRAPANITRLRNGQLNVADNKEIEVAQKSVVYFKPADVSDDELYTIVDDLKRSSTVVRYSTRFVVATNYKKLLAVDTKTGEPLDIKLREIDKHYTYFLPWAGMEKAQFIAENHADVKAAEKMAKLFDILVAHNNYKTADDWHNLTIFFTRLLFCFFAEDTGIFQKNQFINAIGSYTQEDGSDMHQFLLVLFEALDEEDKTGHPAYLLAFPYVNGNLFDRHAAAQIPNFNKEARNLLIESSSKLDWSNINPDIFGSMFQAVIRPKERTGLGQHYTSVPNIMKTIEPLFLDDLKDEFNKAYDDGKRLEQLLGRISAIKVFDPACGSGNFLIIAYKELRKLEHAILERQGELAGHTQRVLFGSRIDIEHFYGIEIDDFAHEVAILSLWLAKHQMNMEFAEKFGVELPLIPLKEAGNVVQGNATRLDWLEVCPNNGKDEIYLIGNPPYQGGKKKTAQQSRDFEIVFKSRKYSKNLDYISLWFIKGAAYIADSTARLAFVSTNSLCQGDHVGLLWPFIYEYPVEIGFAVTSFRWENNAKGGAGVSCIIVSLRSPSEKPKFIFSTSLRIQADRINAYLTDGSDVIVHSRTKTLSDIPEMVYGNMPLEGGFLKLTAQEKEEITNANSESSKFIRRLIGGDSLIKGVDRYCLWIDDDNYTEAIQNPVIRKRIDGVRKFREGGGEVAKTLANRPHQFRYRKLAKQSSIAVPCTSTERREYIPADIFPADCVLDNSVQALYDAPLYVLGLISSRMHMAWVRAVAGQLETRIRYSAVIVYNTFPVPRLSNSDTEEIENKVFGVLDAREGYPEKTLAWLYDPDTMPDDLRIAHQELDETVDKLYRNRPFDNDEERLSHLFDMYKTMVTHEREHIL